MVRILFNEEVHFLKKKAKVQGNNQKDKNDQNRPCL